MSAVSGSRATNTIRSQKARLITANPNGSREERRAAKKLGVSAVRPRQFIDPGTDQPEENA